MGVFIGVKTVQRDLKNELGLDNLLAIANAMEQFRADHFEQYPDIREQLNGNQNVLCYDASAQYAHDCSSAAFVQGYIDNDLLTRRYLPEVPVDPWTGSRYVYGRSLDGRFYQVAGLWQNDEEEWEARTVDNLEKGFPLPSIVRAFDGPNFVVQRGEFLPYNPDATILVATVRNVSGTLKAGGTELQDGDFFREDSFYRKDTEGNETRLIASNTLSTVPDGRADLYFSDGSVTSLEPGTELELTELAVAENDRDSLITKIKTKLLSGRIWNKVVRLSRASEFNVETTSAIAGVRGTEFGVEVSPASGTEELTVLSGKIQVNERDGTLRDFVDSVPEDGTEDLDVSSPVRVDLAAPTVVPALVPDDGLETIREEHYSELPLTSILVPRIIAVDSGVVRIRNLYAQLGIDPTASPLTIPLTRIWAEYGPEARRLTREMTFGRPDLDDHESGEDYLFPFDDGARYEDVILRFEELRGTEVIHASAWSTTPFTVEGTETLETGETEGNTEAVPEIAEWNVTDTAFVPWGEPDTTNLPHGIWVRLENFTLDPADPPRYEVTSGIGGACSGSGEMTANPQSLGFTAALPLEEDNDSCDFRLTLTLPDGQILTREKQMRIRRGNPPPEETSSRVTGQRPRIGNIRARTEGDTLNLTLDIDLADHVGMDLQVFREAGAGGARTPVGTPADLPAGRDDLVIPLPITPPLVRGEPNPLLLELKYIPFAAVEEEAEGAGVRGRSEAITWVGANRRALLDRTAAGGDLETSVETISYSFTTVVTQPTIIRVEFVDPVTGALLSDGTLTPGDPAGLRVRVAAMQNNEGEDITGANDVTDLCDWSAGDTTFTDAPGAGTGGTLSVPPAFTEDEATASCVISAGRTVTLDGTEYAFPRGAGGRTAELELTVAVGGVGPGPGPLPTIDIVGDGLDCTGGPLPGSCRPGNITYPFSFSTTGATSFSITVAPDAGNAGTPATIVGLVGGDGVVAPATGTIPADDTTTVSVQTGSDEEDTMTINITATGAGGSTTDSFSFTQE